jgi:hypothetical protein
LQVVQQRVLGEVHGSYPTLTEQSNSCEIPNLHTDHTLTRFPLAAGTVMTDGASLVRARLGSQTASKDPC